MSQSLVFRFKSLSGHIPLEGARQYGARSLQCALGIESTEIPATLAAYSTGITRGWPGASVSGHSMHAPGYTSW